MTTCRVCGEGDSLVGTRGTLIKYGVRHYAHADCALTRWGASFFDRLPDWPLKRFPVLSAERAGLLPALEQAIATREKAHEPEAEHGS